MQVSYFIIVVGICQVFYFYSAQVHKQVATSGTITTAKQKVIAIDNGNAACHILSLWNVLNE